MANANANDLLESVRSEISPDLQDLAGKEPRKALNLLSKKLQSKSLSAASEPKLKLFEAKNYCPHCWRVDAYLFHYKIPFEHIPVDLAKKENRTPEYLKVNPTGKVPALLDESNGGLIATESGALLYYLDDAHGKGIAKPSDPAELAKMYQILYRVQGNLKSFETGVLLWGREFDQAKQDALLEEYKFLEQELEGRDFLATKDAPSLADWMVLPEVSISKMCGLDFGAKGLKNLGAWLERMHILPGVSEGDITATWSAKVEEMHGSWDKAPKAWA